jgi:hypothetical protein
MPQLMKPTKVKIMPKDGELEITLNINITIDGQVTASAENAKSVSVEEDKVAQFIPDFKSGLKLNFGKNEGN